MTEHNFLSKKELQNYMYNECNLKGDDYFLFNLFYDFQLGGYIPPYFRLTIGKKATIRDEKKECNVYHGSSSKVSSFLAGYTTAIIEQGVKP
jgi:hypothetical protein